MFKPIDGRSASAIGHRRLRFEAGWAATSNGAPAAAAWSRTLADKYSVIQSENLRIRSPPAVTHSLACTWWLIASRVRPAEMPTYQWLGRADQDRLRLGRLRPGRQLASLVRRHASAAGRDTPLARPGRSGQAWTAARLVVHRLASAAGGEHIIGSTGPIGIAPDLGRQLVVAESLASAADRGVHSPVAQA